MKGAGATAELAVARQMLTGSIDKAHHVFHILLTLPLGYESKHNCNDASCCVSDLHEHCDVSA